ncbi:hypothetical protein [Brevibacillus centrosporus]|jgi:hypothetical protein|uniref:Uncharacterized protein n=1 Tax=Brevibacillus centrosporus TaxID=54910 RepID=A0A1I3ZLG8_9BACL|nr:hypothetical protein [Brevibacillus centrosporus]MEC2127914.1 hypothetical protein [Brevibacillus centrosporus]MED1953739.1 hypothetical protein [Brevibacillus centrosporus]MED4911639.1 hypothetical protein [Brevibacillus centrosporus]RNB68200.1 hypothetical protein EDM55_17670 [Brevibacillus centrosporus]SFK44790.1 hypothetical protein SAMN05518846_113144 [Brevibacillus centrosporus]
MRHASIQVRGLMTKEEMDRYNAMMEVGAYLEEQGRHDLAWHVQHEVDILILPAIERLKEKGRERDRENLRYMIDNGLLDDDDE